MNAYKDSLYNNTSTSPSKPVFDWCSKVYSFNVVSDIISDIGREGVLS